MLYFALIYNWLHGRIDSFGAELLGAVSTWVTALALVIITIWIIIQGYRMITGQSREPMMALVINMVRVVVIVTLATTVGAVSGNLHDLVTVELTTDINQLFTGNNDPIAKTIDDNLALTQLAMVAIDTVQVAPGDSESAANKARAQAFAIFGTASPPMAAAAMLLLYEITLALIIGLAPLFIMCLIFDQTKALFQKWLLYGLGTLFSMGVLSFVSSLVLTLTAKVAEALWATNIINKITGIGTEGFTSQSMQQGGIGLLMTVLIVSTPPMAAMFFQGTLGNFLTYSAFGGGGGRIGPQGQPPGSYGGHGNRAQANVASAQAVSSAQSGGVPNGGAVPNVRTTGAVAHAQTDTLKHQPLITRS